MTRVEFKLLGTTPSHWSSGLGSVRAVAGTDRAVAVACDYHLPYWPGRAHYDGHSLRHRVVVYDRATRATLRGPLGGFVQNVDVVAADVGAALELLVADLGPDYLGARVVDSETLRPAEDWPVGVYAVNGGRHFYPPEPSDSFDAT